MWQSYGLLVMAVVFIMGYVALFSVNTHTSRRGNLELVLLTIIMTLIIHELLHGLAIKIFGGKVKFHIRLTYKFLPYLYTNAPNQSFTFQQMMITGLAPFVFLSALFLICIVVYPSIILYAMAGFIINVSGSAADLYIVRTMIQYRSKIKYVTYKNGGFDLTL